MSNEKKQETVTIKCPECGEKQEFYLTNLETLKHYEPCNVSCQGCGTIYWVAKISDKGASFMQEAKEALSLPEMFLTVCAESCVLIITPAAPIPEPNEGDNKKH